MIRMNIEVKEGEIGGACSRNGGEGERVGKQREINQ
jgi:hypothetical protein